MPSLLVGAQTRAVAVCINVEASQNNRITTTILGIQPKASVSCYRDSCSVMFMVAVFTILGRWNQPRCLLIDEWVMKMWCI